MEPEKLIEVGALGGPRLERRSRFVDEKVQVCVFFFFVGLGRMKLNMVYMSGQKCILKQQCMLRNHRFFSLI